MTTLHEDQIRDMLLRWYDQFDEHSPSAQFEELLAPEGLMIDLPPAPTQSIAAFRDWYEANNHKFFDGKHTLGPMDIRIAGDTADVRIDMNWTVRTWTPPEPRSTQLSLDMTAEIGIIAHPNTGRPVVQTYRAIDR